MWFLFTLDESCASAPLDPGDTCPIGSRSRPRTELRSSNGRRAGHRDGYGLYVGIALQIELLLFHSCPGIPHPLNLIRF